MEEEVLWRDISLSSLHLPSNSNSNNSNNSNSGVVSLALEDFSVQDFLSSCPPPPNAKLQRLTKGGTHTRVAPVQCCIIDNPSSSTTVVEPHDDDQLLFPTTLCIEKKRNNPESDDSTSDHRKKRQMKNRESAARSRARKQAYTTGLEVKVSRLTEENGRLRRQLEKKRKIDNPSTVSVPLTILYPPLNPSSSVALFRRLPPFLPFPLLGKTQQFFSPSLSLPKLLFVAALFWRSQIWILDDLPEGSWQEKLCNQWQKLLGNTNIHGERS